MGKDKKAKVKIPKEVAGVKIPKKLRKKGNKLIEHANTPMGRELMAAGLVAAAAAMKKRSDARSADAPKPEGARSADLSRAVDTPGQPGTNPERDPAEFGARVAEQVATVVGAATIAAIDRVFGKGGPTAPDAPKPPEAPVPPEPTTH